MESNFEFLKIDWPSLYEDARQNELQVMTDPRSSAFYARRALELMVKWLYVHDTALIEPYQDTLAARLYQQSFKDSLPPSLHTKLTMIHKMGNHAVHSEIKISQDHANVSSSFFWALLVSCPMPILSARVTRTLILQSLQGCLTLLERQSRLTWESSSSTITELTKSLAFLAAFSALTLTFS